VDELQNRIKRQVDELYDEEHEEDDPLFKL
jgi:hypothetical protein